MKAPLQDFYSKRSHIIHGPRLPFRINEGLLMIPRIGGENKVFGEWDDKSTWDSIPEDDYIYLEEFVSDATDSFFTLINELHGKVFDAADKKFKGMRITETKREAIHPNFFSGTTHSPVISAFPPPSGSFNG